MADAPTPTDQPASPPAAPQAPAPAASPDDFISIPRAVLSDYGGDFHAAMRDANSHRANADWSPVLEQMTAAGYTPEQIRRELAGPQADQFAAPAPAGPDMVSQVRQEMQSVLTEFRGLASQDRLAERQQATDRREQDRLNTEAGQHEIDFTRNFLTDSLKFKEPEDGQDGRMYDHMRRGFQHELKAIMDASAPTGLNDEQWMDFMSRPTQEQLDQAAKNADYLQHFQFEAAARVAENQEAVPSATLGEGPGGAETKPDWDTMTREQKREETLKGIDIEDGPIGDNE